jgi:hypothetical protein
MFQIYFLFDVNFTHKNNIKISASLKTLFECLLWYMCFKKHSLFCQKMFQIYFLFDVNFTHNNNVKISPSLKTLFECLLWSGLFKQFISPKMFLVQAQNALLD